MKGKINKVGIYHRDEDHYDVKIFRDDKDTRTYKNVSLVARFALDDLTHRSAEYRTTLFTAFPQAAMFIRPIR